MSNANDFMQWVSDPARINDELFTVEILLEAARGSSGWPFSYVESGWQAQRERARARGSNPAYRPALHRDELQALIDRADSVKYCSGADGEDRPMRDLKALRFFPALENLSIHSSDVSDFTPIATLRKLKYFSIAEYGDLYGWHPVCLEECGEMPVLERLHLALRHPWPDVRAISKWPALIDIRFNGNILACEGIDPLRAARVVMLKNFINGVALRDLSRLPLAPVVRQLTIETTASLEGIERYPSVLNLDVAGCYRDLSPLAAMENITAVTLRSERFHDLRPLTKMRSLREIKFVREWPLDLSPLADCPQLRRVDFEHCAMMRTEVAALNAGLLPEAADFLADTPRPLTPLKCFRIEKDDKVASEHFTERHLTRAAVREEFFDGDEAFQEAEKRAFVNTMQAEFDALLGRGWGLFKERFTQVRRFQDTQRTLELVDIVRRYFARTRLPNHTTLMIEPHGDITDDLKAIKAREEQATAPDADYLAKYHEPESVLRDNEEFRQQREARYEVLKREHFLRLRGEDAAELLSIPNDEAAKDEPEQPEEPLTPADTDDGEGGVAIAPPPTPPPDAQLQDLSEQLMFYLDVYEDCAVADDYWADRAEYTIGVPFVPWTQEAAAP